MRKKLFFAGILFFSFLSCLMPFPKESLHSEVFPLPGKEAGELLSDDSSRISLQRAVENSLAYLKKKISSADSANDSPGPFRDHLSLEKTRRSLVLFREILLKSSDEKEFTRKIRESFLFWETTGQRQGKAILLTGYFEPIIEGSLEPGGEYQFPIYRRPDDLVETATTRFSSGPAKGRRIGRMDKGQLIPYYSRKEIDSQGILKGKGYEIAWLKDDWERFVLHVQGSGQIRLPDGKMFRAGFAASNGRSYRSIGRYLVDQGLIPAQELSLKRAREFLLKHPERMEEIFNLNQRYIFFRPLPLDNQGKEGPLGALDFSLTAGRSIATDHSVFPPYALAYLISWQPVFDETGRVVGRKALRRFVLNQDTGAAMKGPERVDLFCGSGEKAGMIAGEMREEGKIYFLRAH